MANTHIQAEQGWLPQGTDKVVLGLLALALAALYIPSYMELSRTVWNTDEQGHGPIIFAVAVWLFYRHRHAVAELAAEPKAGLAWAILVPSLLMYVLGYSQSFLMLAVISQIGVLAAMILLFKGRAALRLVWFPLFFLVFMTPFPESLVAAVTGPLKSAVSVVAADLLYSVGYPVSRVGVILNVGQYQLLVADACAGLNSMFTLEALGLLYMNLMQYKSATRNVLLAVLVVPIAFGANVVRVMVLVLVTYHFGDAAGQGFVHGFAGMVLFIVGLILVLFTDYVLGWFFKNESAAAKEVAA
ncbi:exosortase B [Rhodoferax sp. TH121]|uniref:exosortase B n=1 Tax=Rhodoferax sp. TH121 TaxID=2022803 RepID=UPI000B965856|nr:exosortase B [Rhodoferax sp. TH121]OYQ39351.1 exosortase B [Rhodoferax sp. TH121]